MLTCSRLSARSAQLSGLSCYIALSPYSPQIQSFWPKAYKYVFFSFTKKPIPHDFPQKKEQREKKKSTSSSF